MLILQLAPNAYSQNFVFFRQPPSIDLDELLYVFSLDLWRYPIIFEFGNAMSFERNYLQLKTFYFDSNNINSSSLSERQYPIIGLYLLFLLSSHRISEFHTELELIPLEQQHNNKYVSFSRQLEQYYMDGFYNKVLRASSDVPLPNYGFFMSLLSETVRYVISCFFKLLTATKLLNVVKRLIPQYHTMI